MDPALKAEVRDLIAELVLTPEEDWKGLEGTSDAPAAGSGDASGGTGGRSTAVSRSEAAELLQISTKHLDRLIAAGHLPSQKAGRRRLIAREDIETYMREAS
ncbi:helix-turn-helix domain-containing protein [Nocardioides sp.]|uniref:helix-turn-helix domain-containing protein n=1 Tax=Nocardioides sp. TaxID=35761 RepID=UPI00260528B6|nr:helix-turn-helix domain-containing protein [Nocardioides sp.]MCW2736105.1 Helix-turn-helix domain [Nocardioides sp.]